MTWTTSRIFGLVFLIGSLSATKIPRIIGGSNSVIKDFPFLVSIRMRGVHNCGGSIITDRHILTAAHCAYDRNEDTFSIHSGTSRTDRIGNVHKVSSIHVHPTYMSRYEVDGSDDIAILTGDSGSTLVSHGEIVGIASRIDTGICSAGVPDIYNNVFYYKDFIDSVINK